MAKTKGRRMGQTPLDLTKNVEKPGAKPKPMIVSKKTGKAFPPPPRGGARIKTATEIYEEHGRPEPKSPEWNACVAALGTPGGGAVRGRARTGATHRRRPTQHGRRSAPGEHRSTHRAPSHNAARERRHQRPVDGGERRGQ